MKKNYKTPMSNLAGAALVLVALLMSFSAAGALAIDPYDNPYGLRAKDVFRCGEGKLTITATWDVTYPAFDSNNIRWYEQPFYGEHIHTGATFETPFLDLSKTYYIDYIHTDAHGQEECGICDRIAVRANISYEVIENRISYPGNFFCKTPGSYQPTVTGISGGTFSAVQVGGGAASLTIDPQTGVIIPETSDIANFEISYTPPTVPGCPTTPAAWEVTITPIPEQTGISYPQPSYCASVGAGTVAVSFDKPGYVKPGNARFSSVPSGLSLHAETGTIDLALCQTGVYIITYTVPGGGGCPPVQASTSVTIERLPIATISYNEEPFCGDLAEGQHPSIEGAVGGTFSAPIGLSIDPSTGVISPTASDPGVYTVTYTIAETDICPAVEAETSVTIRAIPEGIITATVSDACLNDIEPVITFEGSNDQQPYTFVYKIGGGTEQSISTEPDASTVTLTHSTQQAGTFTYTLITVIDANGCQGEPDESIVIKVEIPALAEFFYEDSPYCSDGADNPTITLGEGAVTGTFSYVNSSGTQEGLADFNISTGEFTLANNSTPGTYTVTNTIDESGGCPETSFKNTVIITAAPKVEFSYAKDAYCQNEENPSVILANGSQHGVYSSDPPGVVFLPEGTINLEFTDPGVYTIYNTLSATDGCPEVQASTTVTINHVPEDPQIITDYYDYDGTPKSPVVSSFVTELEGGLAEATITWWNAETGGSSVSIPELTNVGVITATAEAYYASTGCISTSRTAVALNVGVRIITAASSIADKPYDGSKATGVVSVGTVSNIVSGEGLDITAVASDYADAAAGDGKETYIKYTINDGTNGLAANYSMDSLLVTGNITKAMLTVTAHDIDRAFGVSTPVVSYTMSGFALDETETGLRNNISLAGLVSYTFEGISPASYGPSSTEPTELGSYSITPDVSDLMADNYVFGVVSGTMVIYEVIIESTGGTTRAGYNTMNSAFSAINAGTHTETITIKVYANTIEDDGTATLNANGEGDASYTSVSIEPQNNVEISGSASPLIILGNSP